MELCLGLYSERLSKTWGQAAFLLNTKRTVQYILYGDLQKYILYICIEKNEDIQQRIHFLIKVFLLKNNFDPGILSCSEKTEYFEVCRNYCGT